MTHKIRVNMGELRISDNTETVLETLVGCCVALCLYDRVSKIGGLAHVMLPKDHNHKKIPRNNMYGKYADEAIEMLLSRIKRLDKNRKLEAKIVGGANMFFHEKGDHVFEIGKNNVDTIRKLLSEHNIPIVFEDVGSNHGRTIQFSLETGELNIINHKRSNHVDG